MSLEEYGIKNQDDRWAWGLERAESTAQLLDLLPLKAVIRRGWSRTAPESARVESVADHTFGVALLALLYCPEHLDRHRVLELALLHDLPEVVTGDIIPRDRVPQREKAAREEQAVDRLFRRSQNLRVRVRAAVEEYREGRTEEARFVKALDRYEMALQSVLYERSWGSDLQEFRESSKESLERLGVEPQLLERLCGEGGEP